MVYSGDTREGGVRDLVMAIGPERSKPPLHNFNFPCLKWGNQRHLRCMKLSDSDAVKDNRNHLINNGASVDRIRSSRSPPTRFVAATRDYEVRRFKKFKSMMIDDNRAGGGGGDDDVEEGIEAFSEKLMCDLKADADKFQARIFRKEVADERRTTHHHHRRQWEEEYNKKGKSKSKSKSPPLPQSASAVVDSGVETRPWNLRTRRAVCKSPVAGNSVNGKGLRIEERGVSNSSSPLRSDGSGAKSPRVLRGEKRDNKEEEKLDKETEPARPKFAVALSRKEIDEDFMTMLGHRPARRPKKRPRNVQKQLDMLFPGLWLSEVTVDTYKVPELPENNGKR